MDKSNYNVNSLSKALDILDILGTTKKLSLADICQKCGYSKTTCFRLLYTLCEKGFVDKINETDYRLSFKFLKYANNLSNSVDLISVCKPFMKDLRNMFNQAVHLVVLDNSGNGIFIHKENSTRMMQMQSYIGFQLPAYQLATGKMLLSNLEDERLNTFISAYSYEKLTHNTISSKEDLLAELKEIKKKGYSIDNEESELGLCCIAGPIYNYKGKCIAAISISGEVSYMKDHKKTIVQEVLKTCDLCSKSLGA